LGLGLGLRLGILPVDGEEEIFSLLSGQQEHIGSVLDSFIEKKNESK
jgi:hypothetical protein